MLASSHIIELRLALKSGIQFSSSEDRIADGTALQIDEYCYPAAAAELAAV
eukprot:c17355_g1_i1 orf=111-263(-)